MEDFFEWLGQQAGEAIRWVVETLSLAFAGIDDFITGLTDELGMNASIVSIAFLVLGLVLLVTGVRRLSRGKWIRAVLWLALALFLLGWLIN